MFTGLVKLIKGVKEFFLCAFFSYYKLNVVYKENIYGAVLLSETTHDLGILFSTADGINDFIGELLGCHIQNLLVRHVIQNKMSDGMHQMCFTKTGSSIKK